MSTLVKSMLLLCLALATSSCVTKRRYVSLKTELETANKDLGKCGEHVNSLMNQLETCQKEKDKLQNEGVNNQGQIRMREEQIAELRAQIADYRAQRDKQLDQVGNLTVLSQSASDNIKETLAQLERKDKYIHMLQAAKTRADSINLALAVNLKGVLQNGIEDKDVEVKVDKTVVFINLSDKMLYQSGSASLTPRALVVLGKIAKIVESRPDLEVMVEGYTDNVPIKNACIDDNWDLSVKRSTSVVRVLQKNYTSIPTA